MARTSTNMIQPKFARSSVRALLAACALCTAPAMAAQPEGPPGTTLRAGNGLHAGNGPASPEAFRERLQNALEQTSKARAELEHALERLNAGEDPQAIRRDIRMPVLRMLLQPRPEMRGDMAGEGGVLRGGPGAREEGMNERGPRGARLAPRGEERDGDRPSDRMGGPGRDRPDGPREFADRGPAEHGPGEHGPGERGPGGPGPRGAGEADAPPPGAVLELLRTELPEFMGKVDELRKTDPAMAERLVARVLPRLRGIVTIRENDPEMFRVRMDEFKGGMRVLELMRDYRNAKKAPAGGAAPDASAVDRARTALREGLAAQFDSRLKVQEMEATRLEARLKEVRGQVEKRRAEREDIVTDLLEAVDRGEGPMEMMEHVPR